MYEPNLSKVPRLAEYERIVRMLKYESMKNPDIKNVLPLTVAITGARIREVLMLTTIDIDFDTARLYVPTLKRKGRPKRVVPVPSWYLPIINSYIVRNAISHELFPISRSQAYRIVKKKTGYHPHAFRHAAIMYFLYKGLDPETVRRITGHKSWKMIEYYVRLVRIDVLRTPLEEVF